VSYDLTHPVGSNETSEHTVLNIHKCQRSLQVLIPSHQSVTKVNKWECLLRRRCTLVAVCHCQWCRDAKGQETGFCSPLRTGIKFICMLTVPAWSRRTRPRHRRSRWGPGVQVLRYGILYVGPLSPSYETSSVVDHVSKGTIARVCMTTKIKCNGPLQGGCVCVVQSSMQGEREMKEENE
jgi:hypothetical protein